ncbi:MAG TPA: pyrroline-5-carboxylate reductase [Rhizomicrobium sp.]|jgi:pyrroline-5-carboxylate reductase|nr:pyrroline-5-carboxylate reductase [Rhizomicrobium sp.]
MSKTSTARPILLIGAGRMGGALLKGWTQHRLGPVIAVEPSPSAELKAFARTHHIALFAHAASIDTVPARACIVALKPQILKTEAARLAPIAQSGALMLSIAAGSSIAGLRRAWGAKSRIVRAMPNTPGAIGRGITALYAGSGTTAADKTLATRLLAALGETVWVRREADIDAVTAVSGSGPAYVFLLVEALAAAAEAEGLARPLAEKLARATVTGAGALLDADPSPPALLRRAVTSPHGTTEAALDILMATNGLAPLLRRAVAAARRRARQLGA